MQRLLLRSEAELWNSFRSLWWNKFRSRSTATKWTKRNERTEWNKLIGRSATSSHEDKASSDSPISLKSTRRIFNKNNVAISSKLWLIVQVVCDREIRGSKVECKWLVSRLLDDELWDMPTLARPKPFSNSSGWSQQLVIEFVDTLTSAWPKPSSNSSGSSLQLVT